MNRRTHQVYLPPTLRNDQPDAQGMGVSLTSLAKDKSSVWFLKNRRVAASFSGRLLYAASSQLAISFLCKSSEQDHKQSIPTDLPYRSDKAVNEDLVLLRRCPLSGVPNFTIATLHQPTLEVDRVANVWDLGDLVC